MGLLVGVAWVVLPGLFLEVKAGQCPRTFQLTESHLEVPVAEGRRKSWVW